MSMVICDHCGDCVDSDDHPDGWVDYWPESDFKRRAIDEGHGYYCEACCDQLGIYDEEEPRFGPDASEVSATISFCKSRGYGV